MEYVLVGRCINRLAHAPSAAVVLDMGFLFVWLSKLISCNSMLHPGLQELGPETLRGQWTEDHPTRKFLPVAISVSGIRLPTNTHLGGGPFFGQGVYWSREVRMWLHYKPAWSASILTRRVLVGVIVGTPILKNEIAKDGERQKGPKGSGFTWPSLLTPLTTYISRENVSGDPMSS